MAPPRQIQRNLIIVITLYHISLDPLTQNSYNETSNEFSFQCFLFEIRKVPVTPSTPLFTEALVHFKDLYLSPFHRGPDRRGHCRNRGPSPGPRLCRRLWSDP